MFTLHIRRKSEIIHTSNDLSIFPLHATRVRHLYPGLRPVTKVTLTLLVDALTRDHRATIVSPKPNQLCSIVVTYRNNDIGEAFGLDYVTTQQWLHKRKWGLRTTAISSDGATLIYTR